MIREAKIIECDVCGKNNFQSIFSYPVIGIFGQGLGFDFSFCDGCLKNHSAFGLITKVFEQIAEWENNERKENQKLNGKHRKEPAVF